MAHRLKNDQNDAEKTPPHEDIQEDNPQLTATENFRDGVNERIEDEAHMAQKTAYQLSYTSKFKQMNSEEMKSMQPRERMMPQPSVTTMHKRTSEGSNLWSQSTTSMRPSDPSSYQRNLVHQMSHNVGTVP